MASQGGTLSKFDPAKHPVDLYAAFSNFVDSFGYEYEAIAKQPPQWWKGAGKVAWFEYEETVFGEIFYEKLPEGFWRLYNPKGTEDSDIFPDGHKNKRKI